MLFLERTKIWRPPPPRTLGGKFKCDECDRHFSSSSNLKSHKKAIHLGLKLYKCKCGQEFQWGCQLQRHRKKCSSFFGVESSQKDPSDKSDGGTSKGMHLSESEESIQEVTGRLDENSRIGHSTEHDENIPKSPPKT